MRRTGWLWDERFTAHDPGDAAAYVAAGGLVAVDRHVESALTKQRFADIVEASGLAEDLVRLVARPATDEQLLAVHAPDYLERLSVLSDGPGAEVENGVNCGPGSYEIARLAAGSCIAALEAVCSGEVDNAYALVRPPGHHAERAEAMGFCLLANIVIAVQHARRHLGIRRVAVVDWDVHHGNGTESAFANDPSVLTVSLHQDHCFPSDRGAVEDRGAGPGLGTNVNVPLPPGSGRPAYLAALEAVVAPALRAFEPEVIVVASGFDASGLDPLGRMMLSSEDFRDMTGFAVGLADELCGGRILLVNEGGYSEAYVPFCGLAVVEELVGAVTRAADPFLDFVASWPADSVLAHQQAAIDAARDVLDLPLLAELAQRA
ncbi:class II histone deacetylase [Patulibacter sp.]|uniref:class II histone deacetylase n=1 Tax=Patulibacter sp. TaxID=1912859 RepID=UPI00272893D4|nr:class II histone deacetylase [Patulibacter sp.]MDO9409004.1 class II histone deacetylase [Patulibacter sp.]